MEITKFFNNDYVSYASYDNIRKIANYLDGLKSASRKVLYTFLEDNINKDLKVNRAAAKVSEKCLTGETIIPTDKGDFRLDELVEKIKNNGEYEEYFVKSYNEKTNRIEDKKIIDADLVKYIDELIEIETENDIIRCTIDHKFYVRRNNKLQCVEAQNLKEDKLFNIDKNIIRKIKLKEKIPVYDITVEDNHNYFLKNGILTHNCEYLHGETSLEGVIAGMAQTFVSSNNLPLLSPEGSFGTRFIPKASASRYIYTKLQPYLRLIFRKEDDPLLEKQIFEGNTIEYKYYVPIIPMLLVNGSSGVSNGFAQKILPRKIKTIIDAIKNKLNENEIDLKPGIEGFKGDIAKYENGWEIIGKFERIGKTRLIITEIPIQYSLKKYISVLDKLEEKKIIRKYKDLSEEDIFKFEIEAPMDFIQKDDRYILEKLKLIQKEVENFSTINEENSIKVFNNEYELFDNFFEVRLQYYTKRKEHQLKKLKEEIDFLKDRIKFINLILENKIVINKKSKKEIIEQAKQFDIKFIEEHLKMQLWNLTKEKIDDLLNIIDTKENEYNELLNKTEKQIWLDELNELESALPKLPKSFSKSLEDKKEIKETTKTKQVKKITKLEW